MGFLQSRKISVTVCGNGGSPVAEELVLPALGAQLSYVASMLSPFSLCVVPKLPLDYLSVVSLLSLSLCCLVGGRKLVLSLLPRPPSPGRFRGDAGRPFVFLAAVMSLFQCHGFGGCAWTRAPACLHGQRS